VRNKGDAPTMRDIGRLAGVAPITVSRALRGDASVLSETRETILKAAKELGYVQNHAARALAKRGSRLIALIVPNVSNSVFAETIDGLTDYLVPTGFSLTIGYSGYSKENEERLVRLLLGYRPEGVILTGFTHTRATRALLRQANVPVVEMWNIGERPIDMAVGFSNFEAAREMTGYLIERGHKRIHYAGGTQVDNDRTRAREAGFRQAMARARLPVDDSAVVSMPMEFECGCELARDVAGRKRRPDAIFIASDIIAAGFILESRRTGIRIPDDIAIAGFDNTNLGSIMDPPLTTVHVPRREIGEIAGEMVLRRLQGTGDDERERDLGFRIVKRDSA
jgi:LacI family gluconate utilization system Gnt-I transcriptional repressor